MYSSYTESAAQIAARMARILASLPKVQAPVCLCLKYIGDNGPCPVPGHTRAKPATVKPSCDGVVVFELVSGGRYCMNCGGDHG